MSTKRHILTVGEKLDVIKMVNEGLRRKKDIAAMFKISESTLHTLLRNRVHIESRAKECNVMSKRGRQSAFPDLEARMLKWVKDCRENAFTPSDTLIKEKASSFSRSLALDNFKSSRGWVNNFKKRHSVLFKNDCGVIDECCNEAPVSVKNNPENDQALFDYKEIPLPSESEKDDQMSIDIPHTSPQIKRKIKSPLNTYKNVHERSSKASRKDDVTTGPACALDSVKCRVELEKLCSNIKAKIEAPRDIGDPNLLVDRLRIIVASSQAGSHEHTEEIINIISDLRNGGYITGYGNDVYYQLITPGCATAQDHVWQCRPY